MAGAWDIRDTYETIEQWARLRNDHSLIRDKTALAILVLAESIHFKDQPMALDEILAGAITPAELSQMPHPRERLVSKGVREAA